MEIVEKMIPIIMLAVSVRLFRFIWVILSSINDSESSSTLDICERYRIVISIAVFHIEFCKVIASFVSYVNDGWGGDLGDS